MELLYWIFWIIIVIAVVGFIVWYMKSRKKETIGEPPAGIPQEPTGEDSEETPGEPRV